MFSFKGTIDLLVDSTKMLRSWECKIDSDGGIAVFSIYDDLRSLTAEIISRASFGSSYSEGQEMFLKPRTLQKILS